MPITTPVVLNPCLTLDRNWDTWMVDENGSLFRADSITMGLVYKKQKLLPLGEKLVILDSYTTDPPCNNTHVEITIRFRNAETTYIKAGCDITSDTPLTLSELISSALVSWCFTAFSISGRVRGMKPCVPTKMIDNYKEKLVFPAALDLTLCSIGVKDAIVPSDKQRAEVEAAAAEKAK